MKIDALDILSLNVPNKHLSGRYDVRYPKLNRLFCVKALAGFPIDIRAYDDNFVYDNFTEGDPPSIGNGHDGWKDPTDFKWHVGNRMRGNKIMPRWIEYPFTVPLIVSDDDSPLGMLKGGIWDGVSHSVGPTKYILHPPTLVKDWGGDVGRIPIWLLEYFYGKNFGSMETYEYAYDPVTKKGFGLIHWTLNGYKASAGVGGSYEFIRGNSPSIHLGDFKAPNKGRLVVHPFFGLNGELPL